MKVLVTGANGQLGHDLVNELASRGHVPVGVDVAEMDVTDPEAVRRVMLAVRPDAVAHLAAWTAVDAAEDYENRDKVYAINALGTRYVAEQCRVLGCKMLYTSTDYVFDGGGTLPHKPDDTDFNPLGVYGMTKLDGEDAVRELVDKRFIVRISWVFGAHGKNFVKTMLSVGKTHDSVRVVCDQIGAPTYTFDLSRLLTDMLETEKYGTYHATNEGGFVSWYDFTREIFALVGYKTEVVPVTTVEYGLSKAARPLNSRLDTSKLAENGFRPLPDRLDALKRFLTEMEK